MPLLYALGAAFAGFFAGRGITATSNLVKWVVIGGIGWMAAKYFGLVK